MELSGEFQHGHEHVKAAMARAGVASLVHVVAYCEEAECPVRDFDIKLKHVDEIDLVRALACPWCGSLRVSVHGAETLDEREASLNRNARERVNVQMLQRDRPAPGGLHVMTIGEFTDDRLPPTPPGWWEKADSP